MDTRIEAIWTEFGEALRRFILRRVGDAQVADDILQDVFVKIHTHIDTLKDERKLQSWIYQITRNAIADYYRKPQLAHALPHNLLDDEPADDEITRRLASSLRDMLNFLPDEYRQPLELTVFEGLSQKEVGERLGLSLSGAKSRVQRGRDKLRDLLLDCCHFEFDRLGKVIDYHPRVDCCAHCNCERD